MSSYAPLPVVAIIGGGFTGAAVAVHLAERGQAGVAARIVVFEPREKLGAGLAYDTNEAANRINVPAGRMSLYPDDPESFIRWIEENDALKDDPDAFADDGLPFPRRHVFGDYAYAQAAPHLSTGRIEHRRAEVTGLRRSNGRWRVSGADGADLEADHVVLAVSHPAPAAPRVLSALASHPRFIPDATVAGAVDGIRPGDRVLIVGNGLTSADVVAALANRGHTGRIVSISRRGLRSRGHPAIAQEAFGDFVSEPSHTASHLLARIRRTLREAAALGLTWHPVLDAVRGQGQEIWKALPLIERQRLARHARVYWDVHRFRIAPQVEKVLDDAIAAGRLEILAAALAYTTRSDEDIRVGVRLRDGGVEREIEADAVVVTTGPAHDGILHSQPFFSQLEEQGYLSFCATGLGLSCDRQSRALGANGEVASDLFIAGPLARGTFGELMGLPQVAEHAAAVAGELAKALERQATDRQARRGVAG